MLVLGVAIAFAGLLVTARTVKANHDDIRWSNPQGVTFAPTDETLNDVLADGKGHVYFFYNAANGASFNNLTMTKYSTMGAFGQPTFLFSRQVTTDVTSARTVAQLRPSATIDHFGNLYVAWTKSGPYTSGRNDEVYVSKSVDGGNTWLLPVLASSPTGFGNDRNPSIAAAPDGTIWVAWQQNFGGWWNTTVSSSSTAGASFAGFTNISSPAARFYAIVNPNVVIDPSGRVYVGYSRQATDGYYYIQVAWTDNGSTWTTVQVTSAKTNAYYPSVVAEANGKVHIAWWDNRFASTGGWTIWYRQSPDRGSTWWPEVLLSSAASGLVGFDSPNLNLLGQNIFVTWAAFANGLLSVGYGISATDGASWYPAAVHTFEFAVTQPASAMDENGTVWLGMSDNRFGNYNLDMAWWNGPPSPPVITAISSGTGSLTVTWNAPPEKDVVSYHLWRSADALTYQAVTTVPAASTSYTDAGLANGTYWYVVTADDNFGTPSHPSGAMSGTVGPTTADLIAGLQAQLNALQTQLNSQGADIAAIQTQLNSIQSQLTNLQSTTGTQYTNLQNQLNNLQTRLDQIETEKATQTQSNLNTLLIIIVIVMLVFMILQSRRSSAMRAQIPRPEFQAAPPSPPMGPTMGPSPPSPKAPGMPEDEL